MINPRTRDDLHRDAVRRARCRRRRSSSAGTHHVEAVRGHARVPVHAPAVEPPRREQVVAEEGRTPDVGPEVAAGRRRVVEHEVSARRQRVEVDDVHHDRGGDREREHREHDLHDPVASASRTSPTRSAGGRSAGPLARPGRPRRPAAAMRRGRARPRAPRRRRPVHRLATSGRTKVGTSAWHRAEIAFELAIEPLGEVVGTTGRHWRRRRVQLRHGLGDRSAIGIGFGLRCRRITRRCVGAITHDPSIMSGLPRITPSPSPRQRRPVVISVSRSSTVIDCR